jgi:hypothetical protein
MQLAFKVLDADDPELAEISSKLLEYLPEQNDIRRRGATRNEQGRHRNIRFCRDFVSCEDTGPREHALHREVCASHSTGSRRSHAPLRPTARCAGRKQATRSERDGHLVRPIRKGSKRLKNWLTCWRRGAGSNRRIKVLQTSALPLGYRAASGTGFADNTGLLFAPYRAALAEVNSGVSRRASFSGITGSSTRDGYCRE